MSWNTYWRYNGKHTHHNTPPVEGCDYCTEDLASPSRRLVIKGRGQMAQRLLDVEAAEEQERAR